MGRAGFVKRAPPNMSAAMTCAFPSSTLLASEYVGMRDRCSSAITARNFAALHWQKLQTATLLPAILLILLVNERVGHAGDVVADDSRQRLLGGFFAVVAREV